MQMHDITCFFIDDDPDDLVIFNIALKSIDKVLKCISAVNGVEALEKLNSNTENVPDFIFLDLNMPLMDGKECLIELRKNLRFKDVPVVIFTTSSLQKDIEETERLGATHFFTKPSNISTLAKVLNKLFQKQTLSFCLNTYI